jgi:RNA polymerase sigma-70 factor (sigma-E family)
MDASLAFAGGTVADKGDADFSEFFTSSWPRLFRVIHTVAGDAASAEDALQSAYAKAFASWRRVSSTNRPEAYVRRMALNELFAVRRRAWWRAERSDGGRPSGTHDSHDSGVVDRDAVWRAVLALPMRQRAVIVLRYYEDLSERDIAKILGCSAGTVKSQASDALATLRAAGAHQLTDPSSTGDPS